MVLCRAENPDYFNTVITPRVEKFEKTVNYQKKYI